MRTPLWKSGGLSVAGGSVGQAPGGTDVEASAIALEHERGSMLPESTFGSVKVVIK